MQKMLQFILRYLGDALVFDNLIELTESYLKRADKAQYATSHSQIDY